MRCRLAAWMFAKALQWEPLLTLAIEDTVLRQVEARQAAEHRADVQRTRAQDREMRRLLALLAHREAVAARAARQ